MYKRQIQSFRLDKTYGFQHYPIITLPEDISLIDAPAGSCCQQMCPYINYCTLMVPCCEKSNLRFDDIIAAFPDDLSVPDVYWAHTGQGPLSEMFEKFPKNSNTCVFAENQRAALRIRKNKEGVIQYIGFELERLKSEDVNFILYLARTVQSCTSTPMYFCEGASYSMPAKPMLLNGVDFENWVRRQTR